MMLFVDGTDITRIALGLVATDRSHFVVEPSVVAARPEEYLATIDAFLAKHGHDGASALTGIVAVRGPGSATALRTSLALVNTIAFARSIPIFAVTLDNALDRRAAIIGLADRAPASIVHPVYANDARITTSGKDVLGRSLSSRV